MKNLGLKIGYGLFLSVFLILMGVARPTWCYDGPDDPKAIAAADAAINALGPDHGAIDITGKVVGITGFQALEVTGTKGRIKGVSKDIEKVLTDTQNRTLFFELWWKGLPNNSPQRTLKPYLKRNKNVHLNKRGTPVPLLLFINPFPFELFGLET